MRTHLQKIWPLIIVARTAGLLALIAGIRHLCIATQADWQLDMCIGLGWFILADLEELIARSRDKAEKQG